jgi:N-acetylglucosaminyl transferase component (Gpi1)
MCSFYNNVWLIFNDVVIGAAVGTILSENHQYFGELLYMYTEVFTPLAPILLADALSVALDSAIHNRRVDLVG